MKKLILLLALAGGVAACGEPDYSHTGCIYENTGKPSPGPCTEYATPATYAKIQAAKDHERAVIEDDRKFWALSPEERQREADRRQRAANQTMARIDAMNAAVGACREWVSVPGGYHGLPEPVCVR
jgi:hypothetical protein